MNKILIILLSIVVVSCQYQENKPANISQEQQIAKPPKIPLMGWASWNSFRVDINEEIVMANADAMISSGLKDAGYTYILILMMAILVAVMKREIYWFIPGGFQMA